MTAPLMSPPPAAAAAPQAGRVCPSRRRGLIVSAEEGMTAVDRLGESNARPACGTDSGYFWHRRSQSEQPCQACRAAHAAAERARRMGIPPAARGAVALVTPAHTVAVVAAPAPARSTPRRWSGAVDPADELDARVRALTAERLRAIPTGPSSLASGPDTPEAVHWRRQAAMDALGGTA